MSKLIEVEVRILLKNRQAIENRLSDLGGRVAYASHLIDYWFCPDRAKNYKEASIDKTGFALRIRESKDLYSGKEIASLECKTRAGGHDHALCNEHEIDINDIKSTRQILDDIGLKEFLVIDKQRVIYEYKKAKFCFDKIKNFGDGLEIEIMTRGKLNQAKERAIKLALELGIRKEDILEKSLVYLAMQKLGKY